MHSMAYLNRAARGLAVALSIGALLAACESPKVRELATATAANTETLVALLKDHQTRRAGAYAYSARITAEDVRDAEPILGAAELDAAMVRDKAQREAIARVIDAFEASLDANREDIVLLRQSQSALLSQLASAELDAAAIKDLNKALATLGTELDVDSLLKAYKPLAEDVLSTIGKSLQAQADDPS